MVFQREGADELQNGRAIAAFIGCWGAGEQKRSISKNQSLSLSIRYFPRMLRLRALSAWLQKIKRRPRRGKTTRESANRSGAASMQSVDVRG